MITLALNGTLAVAACGSSLEPAVTTDQADYPPFGTATISGSGFDCGQTLSVLVTAPDGTTRSGDSLGSAGPDSVTADANGQFVLNYALSGTFPDGSFYLGQEGNYTVAVLDTAGVVLATTTFSDGLGGFHTCVLMGSGGMQCWGFNGAGRLGDGTMASSTTPVQVTGLSGSISQISLGGNHSCALTSGGGIMCWGYNYSGELGTGGPIQGSPVPVWVNGLSSSVAHISAGVQQTCAVLTDGSAKCWGYNAFGQLGDGSTTTRRTPVDVVGLNGDAVQIDTGMYHSCALMADGGVKCWGRNSSGQLGNGATTPSLTPVDVIGLGGDAIQVSVGSLHTCALLHNGGVQCWGAAGSLGDGASSNRSTPVNVVGLSAGVAQISAGTNHTCAVTTSDGLKCWGFNWQGQLGSTITTALTPVDLFGLTSGIAQVRVGSSHTCALTTAGGVKCWGWNASGQLGDGTTISRDTPVDVIGLTTGVVQLPDAILSANEPPVANAAGPYEGDEGALIALSGASASDADSDALSFAWTVDSALCSFEDPSQLNPTISCTDNGNFNVILTVDDGSSVAVSSGALVTVHNVAPTLSAISVDHSLLPVNTTVNTSASFTDLGLADTHTGLWSWDDGATAAASITEVDGSGLVSGSHSYDTAGVYAVSLTVTDKDGASSNESVYQYVVVYDPSAGFVTGSGWIESPAGAYTPGEPNDPDITGKANFGFVSRYKNGATVPTGNTMFSFRAGELNFHSSVYDWLVVNQAGANAQFKGSGTINGKPAPGGELYKFTIWAKDDDPSFGDTFRIRIWYEQNGVEIVVYDNGVHQAIGSGNIQIHNQ